jgi:hypothetical protein
VVEVPNCAIYIFSLGMLFVWIGSGLGCQFIVHFDKDEFDSSLYMLYIRMVTGRSRILR